MGEYIHIRGERMINLETLTNKEKRTRKYIRNGLNITVNLYGEVNPELMAKSVIKLSEKEELQKFL